MVYIFEVVTFITPKVFGGRLKIRPFQCLPFKTTFRTLIRAHISTPFLPAEQILSTYNQLELEDIFLSADNMTKLTTLKTTVEPL